MFQVRTASIIGAMITLMMEALYPSIIEISQAVSSVLLLCVKLWSSYNNLHKTELIPFHAFTLINITITTMPMSPK
jgi:hypothetical protein